MSSSSPQRAPEAGRRHRNDTRRDPRHDSPRSRREYDRRPDHHDDEDGFIREGEGRNRNRDDNRSHRDRRGDGGGGQSGAGRERGGRRGGGGRADRRRDDASSRPLSTGRDGDRRSPRNDRGGRDGGGDGNAGRDRGPHKRRRRDDRGGRSPRGGDERSSPPDDASDRTRQPVRVVAPDAPSGDGDGTAAGPSPMDAEFFPKLDNADPDHARRIQQRRRMVMFGKNTTGYDEYVKEVPKHKRRPRCTDHPVTPDHTMDIPTRRWQGLIKTWRISLHKFDPPDLADSSPKGSAAPKLAPRPAKKAEEMTEAEEQIERARAAGLQVAFSDPAADVDVDAVAPPRAPAPPGGDPPISSSTDCPGSASADPPLRRAKVTPENAPFTSCASTSVFSSGAGGEEDLPLDEEQAYQRLLLSNNAASPPTLSNGKRVKKRAVLVPVVVPAGRKRGRDAFNGCDDGDAGGGGGGLFGGEEEVNHAFLGEGCEDSDDDLL